MPLSKNTNPKLRFMKNTLPNSSHSEEYKSWILELKQKIRQCQIKAAIKVNTAELNKHRKALANDAKEANSTTKKIKDLSQGNKEFSETLEDMVGAHRDGAKA
jgi:hypothetical protein